MEWTRCKHYAQNAISPYRLTPQDYDEIHALADAQISAWMTARRRRVLAETGRRANGLSAKASIRWNAVYEKLIAERVRAKREAAEGRAAR